MAVALGLLVVIPTSFADIELVGQRSSGSRANTAGSARYCSIRLSSPRGQVHELERYLVRCPSRPNAVNIRGRPDLAWDERTHWTGSDLEIYHGPLYAESVQTVLNDVASFMQTNRRELVILKFSHYDNFDSAAVAYQTLTSWVQNTIGSWLYTGRPSGVRLANLTLNDYVAGGGKVLVVCDGSQPIDDPSPGVYVYRDWSSSDPQNGDLVVFDQYADVTDYSTMKTDQFTKFDDFTGSAQNNSSVPCDLFLLSWTLTPAVDVWSLVGTPDQDLGSDINTLSIPNSSGKIVNIVYTDYVEYSRSTDVAEYLNGIPD